MPDPSTLDPPSGRTLLTGPSNAGKTRLTAALLDAWVAANGASGVVVLEFAPEVRRDGRLLGGRLDRFTAVPDGAWHGVLDAHAPRADGEDAAESLRLAEENAERAADLVAAAPDPTAVFVNDATIPFHHPEADPSRLTRFCGDVAVLNAFESDALGTDDAVSRAERRALRRFGAWADRRRRLEA